MQLAFLESVAVTLLLCLFSGDETNKGFAACLPANVKLEEFVSAPQLKSLPKLYHDRSSDCIDTDWFIDHD